MSTEAWTHSKSYPYSYLNHVIVNQTYTHQPLVSIMATGFFRILCW